MGLNSDFLKFYESIELDTSEMVKTVSEITKKLNKEYYELDGDEQSHMHIVGSVGRNTAIKGASDLDLLFVLPDSTFEKFNDYESNGQSALLQEVKSVLKSRYSRTELRGDGQVVVIDFERYTVELVPGFKKKNEGFFYPDTHNGGTWETTNPLPEQSACEESNATSKGVFLELSHTARAWKNEKGFEFSGLLIDTLVDRFLQTEDYFKAEETINRFSILLNFFDYLRKCDANQKYWLAIGSNQHVFDKGNGAFVKFAKDAFSSLENAIDDGNVNEALAKTLGKEFPHKEKKSVSSFRQTEEFIENKYAIDIRYTLSIDCKITQDGFRAVFLREWLRTGKWLRQHKQLEFFISKTNCPEPYDICWKVKNVGPVAESRDQIRGQIQHTGKKKHIEHSDFYGPHYVECYLIKNGVCVARNRINVPIDSK